MSLSPNGHPARGEQALVAYEALAAEYDRFTDGQAHEALLGGLEVLARRHGLRGRRVLDVGCGTGKSSLPMLTLGYDVTACDLSPAMVEQARRKLEGAPVDLFVADMRDLPPVGQFDLVTCINDSVNYLAAEGDLPRAMRSLAGVMGPGGLLAFDASTLATYGSAWSSTALVERDGVSFCWQGHGDGDPSPGSVHTATLTAIRPGGERAGRPSLHVQRHHPRPAIERACTRAGLSVVAVHGILPGGAIDTAADERRHGKLLYVVRREAAA